LPTGGLDKSAVGRTPTRAPLPLPPQSAAPVPAKTPPRTPPPPATATHAPANATCDFLLRASPTGCTVIRPADGSVILVPVRAAFVHSGITIGSAAALVAAALMASAMQTGITNNAGAIFMETLQLRLGWQASASPRELA